MPRLHRERLGSNAENNYNTETVILKEVGDGADFVSLQAVQLRKKKRKTMSKNVEKLQ